ncbi:uncharacterized protein METZ01_LOCUS402277, partial [marine metagenome]
VGMVKSLYFIMRIFFHKLRYRHALMILLGMGKNMEST